MQQPENLPTSETPLVAPTQTAPAQVPVALSLIATLGRTLKIVWQPAPVRPPEVDPDLTDLSGIQRSTEVLRYKILQLEYELSSGGGLRAWLKLNLLVALLLVIPALLVVPVITFLLSSFATWTGFLFQAAINILYTLVTIVGMVASVRILVYFLVTLRRDAQRQKRR